MPKIGSSRDHDDMTGAALPTITTDGAFADPRGSYSGRPEVKKAAAVPQDCPDGKPRYISG